MRENIATLGTQRKPERLQHSGRGRRVLTAHMRGAECWPQSQPGSSHKGDYNRKMRREESLQFLGKPRQYYTHPVTVATAARWRRGFYAVLGLAPAVALREAPANVLVELREGRVGGCMGRTTAVTTHTRKVCFISDTHFSTTFKQKRGNAKET